MKNKFSKIVSGSLIGVALSAQIVQAQEMFTEGSCEINGRVVDCAQFWNDPIVKMLISGSMILVVLLIVAGIFWLMMLIHAIANPVKNKALWILMMFFFGPLASIIYYITEVRAAKRNEPQMMSNIPPSPNNFR